MPTGSSLLNSISKPLGTNKRLWGLVTFALIIIGVLAVGYYQHIQNNKTSIREYKLQTLDADFDIMSKQILNFIEVVGSKDILDKSDRRSEVVDSIWNKWGGSIENLKSNQEFDQYIIRLVRSPILSEKDTLYVSTLNGLDNIPDNLFDSIPFNIGLSTPIPVKTSEYQLFGKQYHFQGSILSSNERKNLNNDKATTKEDDGYKDKSILKGIEFGEEIGKAIDEETNEGIGIVTRMQIGKEIGKEIAKRIGKDEETNEDIDIDITLIGLIKSENYNESVRKLDPWIISLLSTFLLLCLFGLPYFKLIFIAEDERLSSKDVIWSGFSVIVGGPIVVLIFLSVINYDQDYNITVPNRLKILSEDIAEDFSKENQENISILLDDTLLKRDSCFKDSTKYRRFTPVDQAVLEQGNNKKKAIASLSASYKLITKIDTTGKILYTVDVAKNPNNEKSKAADTSKNKPKTLNSRVYFRDFKENRNIWVTTNGKKYVMRPVVAIQDQKEEAVYIVKDSLEKNYSIGSAQLKSVHAPILPFGYQFAIVDEKGDVWFHSEEGHSTLENIFAVSRQYGDLKAAIIGRVNANGSFTYRDEAKLFHVTPLASTNLSIITFYEIGLLRLRVSEVLTITSIAILAAFLILIIITFLTLVIRNPKLGLYKYDPFLFEFLLPKKVNKNAYILLSLLFITILAIAIIVNYSFAIHPSDIKPPLAFIFSLLIVIWSYLIIFYALQPNRKGSSIKIKVRDIILLCVLIFLNKSMVDLDFTNDDYVLHGAAISMQLIIAYFIFLHGIRGSLPVQLKNICKLKIGKEQISYRYWYSIFLFSWLVLTSIFPAYLFFEKSKNLNDLVWHKADQKYMAQAYIEKEKKLKDILKPLNELQKFDYDPYLKNNGKYPKIIKFQITTKQADTYSGQADKASGNMELDSLWFREFLWKTRPIYDEKVREFQALVYKHSLDDSWRSKEDNENSSFELNYLAEKRAVAISEFPKNWKIEQSLRYSDIYKWIGLLLILSILFSLILFFVDRFFGFRFRHLKPNDFDTNEEKHYAQKFADVLHSIETNFGLLIMGLPFSGKRDFAHEIINVSKYSKTATLSFLRLENLSLKATVPEIIQELVTDVPKKKYSKFDWNDRDLFVIEHLEHNVKSLEANHLKLRLISYLMSEKKRVILISEVYPSQILSLYQNPSEKLGATEGIMENDFNSWRNILSAFPQVLIGITKNRKAVRQNIKREIKELKSKMPHLSFGDIRKSVMPIVKEMSHSKFLPSLAPIVLSKSRYILENKCRLDLQRMVMHTQNLGHGYYNDIWNSLPTRERYMLYDLAKDGFLNIKNRNSLFSLMKKGLIVWKDRPRIFNYSFRNFIITSVSLNEALRLENRNRGRGSWSTIRILFYMIIITILIFIALGKPNLLRNFETVIGALGGLGVIIPLASKFLASNGQK